MAEDDDSAAAEVDLLLAGGWLLTMNDQRDVYRDGAVAVSGTKIVDVGQRAQLAERYQARPG